MRLSSVKYRFEFKLLIKEVAMMTEPDAIPTPSESLQDKPADLLRPPKSILKLVGRAIAQFQMIREGDRILLGLSGGKDSLSLLLVLKHLQRHSPVKFELGVCTIDPEIPGFDPSPLKEWVAALGVPYFYEAEDMVALADAHMKGDSFCSFCSRHKRGTLYSVCRREGYNVLALAQHLDDLAESLLMSAFNAGELRTMKAHYLNNEKDIRIIRPLVRVRESQTRAFAKAAGLPVIQDNCPACYSKPQQRQKMKELLLAQEQDNSHLYANLWHAMQPLVADDNHQGAAALTK